MSSNAKPAKRNKSWGYGLAGAAIVTAAAIVLTYSVSADSEKDSKSGITVPTAVVKQAPMVSVLRLTGVTQAERFQALSAPKMQGSRRSSFRGVQRGSISSPSGSSSSSSSSSTTARSSSSSSSSGSSGSSSGGSFMAGGGGGGQGGAAGGTSEGGGAASGGRGTMSSAMQSSLSRVGGASGGSTATAGRSTALSSGNLQRETSAALGSSGLGSTSGGLSGGSAGPPSIGSSGGGGGRRGGGGGGGSSGRFGLTLLQLVDPGKRVSRGEVVAAFDPENMVNQVDDYEALVRQSQERMKSLLADLEVNRQAHQQLIAVAKADLEKARLDFKTREVRSAIDTELLKLAVEESEAKYKQLLEEVKHVEASLQAQVREAELGLKQVEAELARSKQNLDKMVVHSPIDGIATIYTTWRGGEFGAYKQGDMVGPGSIFLRVVDPASMIVEAKVNQVDIEHVRIGQRATIRVDGFNDVELPGRVVALGAITEQGGMMADYVKQVPIKLKLEKLDPRLVPDLSVSVDLEIAEEESARIVPLSAIFRQGPDRTPHVWVRKGSSWEARPVTLGTVSFTQASIREGLKPGDVVALQIPPEASQAKGSS